MQLPEKLLSSLKGLSGFHEAEFIKTHQQGESVTSIRLNPWKNPSVANDEDPRDFNPHFHISGKVDWSSFGYYLSERPSFTLDPLLHAGAYYVQEASSMFLEQALKQSTDLSKPLRVLDLCAAPGGKSILLQSLISNESLLVSNEVIKTRVHVLVENLIKWGSSNTIVTNNDPKDFGRLENYFDVMLVDAPCSGSGLFRRDPDAIQEWSEENVKLCSLRQQRILVDAWSALKNNGILIYSTCSFSKLEDEDILDWLSENFEVEGIQLKTEAHWNIVETLSEKSNAYGYRFYPDQLKGEGFFIAVLRKKGEEEQFHYPKSNKKLIDKPNKNEETTTRKWISDDHDVELIKKDSHLYALPSGSLSDFLQLQSSLYIKKAGVLLGKLAHDELLPDHELALSCLLSPNINRIDLSKDQALRYLRKEEIKLESNAPGWAVLQFENRNLGWAKILPNRVNSYYPQEWRIRI